MKKQELLGAFDAEIVGIRHYAGKIELDGTFRCRREPGNEYDKNAIKIINEEGEQIGYLDRQTAKVLAPYMDDKSIRLRCDVTGEGDFCIPILVRIYQPKKESSCLSPEELKCFMASLRHKQC